MKTPWTQSISYTSCRRFRRQTCLWTMPQRAYQSCSSSLPRCRRLLHTHLHNVISSLFALTECAGTDRAKKIGKPLSLFHWLPPASLKQCKNTHYSSLMRGPRLSSRTSRSHTQRARLHWRRFSWRLTSSVSSSVEHSANSASENEKTDRESARSECIGTTSDRRANTEIRRCERQVQGMANH